MRLPAKIVAWVLPWFLTGCWFHKSQKMPAPKVAPSIANSSVPPPTQEPPPDLTIPTKQGVVETRLPYESVRPPRHKKPSTASIAVPETPPETSAAIWLFAVPFKNWLELRVGASAPPVALAPWHCAQFARKSSWPMAV